MISAEAWRAAGRVAVPLVLALGGLVSAAEKTGVEVGLVTLEGEEQRQTLVGLSATDAQFERGGLPLKDIAALVFQAPAAPVSGAAALHLRNGDVLSGVSVVAGDEAKLSFRSDTWGEARLEYKFLRALTFGCKEAPAAEALENFLKAAPPKEDQLLTVKGETISGYLEKLSDKDITFSAGGQSRAYAFEQLAAFRFAPLEELKPRAGLLGAIELRNGSRVTGQLLGLQDGKLRFEALNGQPWEVSLDALASITFKGGKLVYLSELTPAAVEEKPCVGGMPVVYRWRRDRAATGGKLLLGAKAYDRGIGVHSYSRLDYDLANQYAKLLCDVGLDAGAPGRGVCTWKVLLDGKEAASGTAQAGGKAQTVSLGLQGVQRLSLVCDYGPDDSDGGDCLDWAGARLVKP